MEYKKCGNKSQICFAKDVFIDGKSCVLVRNGALELLFNKDNALDIVWANFKGVNLSFLSKNGLNDGKSDFVGNFEGGFLYTCGLDNVSNCVKGKSVHGSLHYKKAKNVSFAIDNGAVTVLGEVYDTELFGKNLALYRKYTITENSLAVSDKVVNEGYKDSEYVLLYHVNYGYPFLNECLKIDIPSLEVVPLTEVAKAHLSERLTITSPIDDCDEHVYYNTLKSGEVRLYNPNENIAVSMKYDLNDFPITIEWKSMISGDYALGIEPTFTRFDDFSMRKLKPQEDKNYEIEIKFE